MDLNISSDISARVETFLPELMRVSDFLHTHPETAFEEHKACQLLTQTLASHGFEIEHNLAGCSTAFRATVGTGEKSIAFCAEYDALPTLGHACGHNLIAASSIGAALTIAPFCDSLNMQVIILGTPGEECLENGGKIRLFNSGYFDDLTAAMLVHPAPFDAVAPQLWAAGLWRFVFKGRGGHATSQTGTLVNDALLLSELALSLLDRRSPGADLHVYRPGCHPAANVSASQGELHVVIRAPRLRDVLTAAEMATVCCRAGAASSAVTLDTIRPQHPYTELYQDERLAKTFQQNMIEIGRTPLDPSPRLSVTSDLGLPSTLVPCLHAFMDIGAGGAVNHQPEFAERCVGAGAQSFVRDAVTCLAKTAYEVIDS